LSTKKLDNAPCHTSIASRLWLQEHSIQVLKWPHKPKNLEELKAVIQEEWNKITPQQSGYGGSDHSLYLL
uniref:Tc1-like transposase DDE domain-containing protein n=1 Tax=Amphiprion percula TaxID=161767 RepID=A0A3P8UBP7_AMPPE